MMEYHSTERVQQGVRFARPPTCIQYILICTDEHALDTCLRTH